MKLDIKGIKKAHSDENVTTLIHPDGHEIKVAHKALSNKMRAQLDKMPSYAAGGEVKDRYNIRAAEEVPFTSNPALMDSSTMADEQLPKLFEGEQAPEKFSPNAWKQTEKDIDMDKYVADQDAAAAQVASQRAQQQAIDENAVRARAGVPAVPVPEAQLSPPAQGPQPASLPPMAEQGLSQPGAVAQTPLLTGGMSQIDSDKMVKQYEKGAQQEAQATGELGKKEAAIHDQQVGELQQIHADYQQNTAKLMGEYNAVMSDYRAQHINPNHYQENMSSGQKVRTAIGMILSGMGAGVAGQENMAMKYLNDQIARDVKAQETNMGQTENLLKYNLQQTGNMRDATTLTLAMTKGIYAEKLDQAASLAKDPLAKARALQASAKFKAEAIPLIQKASENQVMTGVLNNPKASPIIKIQALPEKLREPALKELTDYKELQGNLNEVDRIMNKFSDIGINDKINPFSPDDKAQNKAALINVVRSALANDRNLKEGDVEKMVDPFVPSLLSNNSAFRKKGAADLKKMILSKSSGKTPILSEYGIVPQLSSGNSVDSMEGKTASDKQGNRIIMRGGKWVPYGR